MEEADETQYWMEVIRDAELSKNREELNHLLEESTEIVKIMTKAKHSSYTSNH